MTNFTSLPNLIFASSKTSFGNMTLLRGEKEAVIKNRKKFLTSLNIDPKKCVCMSLVHESDVLEVKEEMIGQGIFKIEETIECDGLITNKKDIFLFMVIADCLPIAFFDPKSESFALIHASRHNLVKGIIKNTILKFKKLYKTNPKDLIVEIGPSIGPCCYFESKEKVKRFIDSSLQPYIIETDKTLGCDLWRFAEDLLLTEGVSKQNLTNQKICTYHSGDYFSHVKFIKENLPLDTRFAVILGIKES